MSHREYILQRSYQKNFTSGIFIRPDGTELFKTFELPWKNNQPLISCLKEDVYLVKIWRHPDGSTTFVLEDKHGRTDAMMHIGNYLRDIKGCILTGIKYSNVYGSEPMIMDSTKAFKKLIEETKDIDEFYLRITSLTGEPEVILQPDGTITTLIDVKPLQKDPEIKPPTKIQLAMLKIKQTGNNTWAWWNGKKLGVGLAISAIGWGVGQVKPVWGWIIGSIGGLISGVGGIHKGLKASKYGESGKFEGKDIPELIKDLWTQLITILATLQAIKNKLKGQSNV